MLKQLMRNRTEMPGIFRVTNAIKTVPTLVTLTLALSSGGYAATADGLQTSIAVDLLASFPNQEPKGAVAYQSQEAIKLRSAEFSFFAPIDPRFDGVLTFAAHPEGDQAFGQPEVHEAYIRSSRLIPGIRLKLGQYFLGIGRANQFHQHDWPFILPTLVQTELFEAEEGIIDTGLEVSGLLPLPIFLDLTVGVTNGRDFGHSHSEGERPDSPTHYLRLAGFGELLGWQQQVAVNYVGRTSSIGERMQLVGLDLTAKYKRYGRTLWLLQSEIWQRQLTLDGDIDRNQAAYVFAQYRLDQQWAFGLRYDYQTIPTAKKNHSSAYEIDLSYYSSEYLKFVLGYYQYTQESFRQNQQRADQLLLQTAFILGAHPSHDF